MLTRYKLTPGYAFRMSRRNASNPEIVVISEDVTHAARHVGFRYIDGSPCAVFRVNTPRRTYYAQMDHMTRHELPIEVFHVSAAEARETRKREGEDAGVPTRAGWYWWTCHPGCLPDSDAFGPFRSETAAMRDALDSYGED